MLRLMLRTPTYDVNNVWTKGRRRAARPNACASAASSHSHSPNHKPTIIISFSSFAISIDIVDYFQYHGLASEASSNNTERIVYCSHRSLHYYLFATPSCHGILPAGITPINGAST
jgi:hypothetical protein